MSTIDEQIESSATTIASNISALGDNRGLLAQNILGQLRNLVEGVAVRLHVGQGDVEFHYASVASAIAHAASRGHLNFLKRFHKLLQISASHYTMGGDPSERLMLKYYDYLIRIRALVRTQLGLDILDNLEDFPVDLDPSLREYHQKIAERIVAARSLVPSQASKARYYIHSVRPFFSDGRIYYEVTFYPASNRVSKFDRVIGFTDLDITDKYSANLTLDQDSIQVLGQTMPITIVREWEVSIRPCEFDNFARILNQQIKVSSASSEYRSLMQFLTTTSSSLLDVIDMDDVRYGKLKAWATDKSKQPRIFPMLDQARSVIGASQPGHNVLRYLLLRMNNQIIKWQTTLQPCGILSNLRLEYGCKPFDEMPFCTSLYRHNPRSFDVAESLDSDGRTYELLAHRVKFNVESRGMLYTPVADLEDLGDVDQLIATYNSKLYHTHMGRTLLKDKGHVFIKEYEDGTVDIIEKLQQYAATGVAGYEGAADPTGATAATTWSYRMDNSISTQNGPVAGDSDLQNFTYDNAGRLTDDECTEITYDGFDRIAKATVTGSGAACGPDDTRTVFEYDGLDRQRELKAQEADGSNWTTVLDTENVFDGFSTSLVGQTEAATDDESKPDLLYQLDPAGSAMGFDQNGDWDAQVFLDGDGRGNVTTQVEAGGDIVCAVSYSPFGDPIDGTVGNGLCAEFDDEDDAESSGNTLAYRGAPRDASTGSYQFGTRTYTPSTGAFTTPDSYRIATSDTDLSVGVDPLTANTYTYVNGNPVNLADPTGHDPAGPCSKWDNRRCGTGSKNSRVSKAEVKAIDSRVDRQVGRNTKAKATLLGWQLLGKAAGIGDKVFRALVFDYTACTQGSGSECAAEIAITAGTYVTGAAAGRLLVGGIKAYQVSKAAKLTAGQGDEILDAVGRQADEILATKELERAGGIKSLDEVGSALSHGDLNPGQLSNLARYSKKLPRGADDTVITRGADGAVQFSTDIPGKVPGSYATYTKVVDSSGNTIGYTKTTVAPDGTIIHIKDKLLP